MKLERPILDEHMLEGLIQNIRRPHELSNICKALNNGFEPMYFARAPYGDYQKVPLFEIINMKSTIENVVDFINSKNSPNFRKAYDLVLSISALQDTESSDFWTMVYAEAYALTHEKEEPIADFNDFTE